MLISESMTTTAMVLKEENTYDIRQYILMILSQSKHIYQYNTQGEESLGTFGLCRSTVNTVMMMMMVTMTM